jgi:hypothetical protein
VFVLTVVMKKAVVCYKKVIVNVSCEKTKSRLVNYRSSLSELLGDYTTKKHPRSVKTADRF